MRKSCKDQYDVYYAQAFATVVLLLAILVKSGGYIFEKGKDVGRAAYRGLFGQEGLDSLRAQLQDKRKSIDIAINSMYQSIYTSLFGSYTGDTNAEVEGLGEKIPGLLDPIMDGLKQAFKLEDGQKLLTNMYQALESSPGMAASGALVLNAAVGHKLFAALGSLLHTLLRFLKRSGRVLQPLADRFRSMHGVPAHKLACK
jgi:hypothetical protein